MAQGKVYVLRIHQTNTTEVMKQDQGSDVQTKLNLALHFNTTAIVEPKAYAADVEISKEIAPDASGVWHGQLVNRGKGVADLSRFPWRVAQGNGVKDVPSEQVRYGDAVFIEPGAVRDFTIANTIKGPARLLLTVPGSDRVLAKQ